MGESKRYIRLEIIDDSVIFTRRLHQKNIYQYFPKE